MADPQANDMRRVHRGEIVSSTGVLGEVGEALSNALPPSGGSDVLTAGFSLTPDAVYDIPSAGFVLGDGFTTSAGLQLRRWGHVIGFSIGAFVFNDTDLNDYGFYNQILSLPPAWIPAGTGSGTDQSRPFWAMPTEIEHYSSGDVLKQVDPEVIVPHADGGFVLDNDHLDSSLFASGDYLVFQLGRRIPSMTVLPAEADPGSI